MTLTIPQRTDSIERRRTATSQHELLAKVWQIIGGLFVAVVVSFLMVKGIETLIHAQIEAGNFRVMVP